MFTAVIIPLLIRGIIMLKKLMACIAFLPVCNLALAADWKLFTYATEYFIYIDHDSIKTDSEKNSLDFWYKAVARTSVPTEKMYKGDYGLYYTTLDCETKTLATKSYVSYSAKGSVKESETVEVPVFEPIVPETVGEHFIELCTPASEKPIANDQKDKQIFL